MSDTGVVYLVGAGPGDPGLLTVRAAELIAEADALVYDALVSQAILDRRVPGTEMYFVGKRGGGQSVPQEETSRLLVELARRHARVVRLKGGDPFVFGRGGEEALVLAEAGVRFEVVPGITSGVAAPAYAGIPVTHRGLSASVAFVTGHEDPQKEDSDVDWEHLARGVGTVVFYMGVRTLAGNCRKLIEAGRRADTAVAVVEWGTYPRQRTVTGTLETIAERVAAAQIGAPSIVIVGEVVTLRDRLGWFETGVLRGIRAVVTRARAQASELAAALEQLGAEVIQFPTIRIEAPDDLEPLRRAAREVHSFDWLVFTSANGVEAFWRELRGVGRDTRALAGVSICAIGPATAAAVEAEGARADLIPERFVAESAVEAFRARPDVAGARVLMPRAEVARAVLPDALREMGADVHEVVAYRTVLETSGSEELRQRIAAGDVDLVTFTSSSTVRNFVELVGSGVEGARIASIGPITSETVREVGLQVDVEAAEHTIPGLVEAIRGYYEPSGRPG